MAHHLPDSFTRLLLMDNDRTKNLITGSRSFSRKCIQNVS